MSAPGPPPPGYPPPPGKMGEPVVGPAKDEDGSKGEPPAHRWTPRESGYWARTRRCLPLILPDRLTNCLQVTPRKGRRRVLADSPRLGDQWCLGAAPHTPVAPRGAPPHRLAPARLPLSQVPGTIPSARRLRRPPARLRRPPARLRTAASRVRRPPARLPRGRLPRRPAPAVLPSAAAAGLRPADDQQPRRRHLPHRLVSLGGGAARACAWEHAAETLAPPRPRPRRPPAASPRSAAAAARRCSSRWRRLLLPAARR